MLLWSQKEAGPHGPPLWVFSSATLSWWVNRHRHWLQLGGGWWWHSPVEPLAVCPEGGRCRSICLGLSFKCKCVWGVESRVLPHKEKERSKWTWSSQVGRGRECQWTMSWALLCRSGESCPMSQLSVLSDSNCLWLLFLLWQWVPEKTGGPVHEAQVLSCHCVFTCKRLNACYPLLHRKGFMRAAILVCCAGGACRLFISKFSFQVKSLTLIHFPHFFQ